MKNVILTCLLCLSASAAFSQGKFGHVNTGLVFEALPESAAADSMLRLYQDSLRSGMAALQEEYSTMLKIAQDSVADMTPKQIETKQQLLTELGQQMQVFEQESARMFEQRRGQYLTPIVQRLQAAITAFAKTNGYTMIFDSSIPQALLFAEDSVDLTPLLIAELTKA